MADVSPPPPTTLNTSTTISSTTTTAVTVTSTANPTVTTSVSSATTDGITSSSGNTLPPEEPFPVLAIVGATLGGIFLVLVLVLVIVIKRRRKRAGTAPVLSLPNDCGLSHQDSCVDLCQSQDISQPVLEDRDSQVVYENPDSKLACPVLLATFADNPSRHGHLLRSASSPREEEGNGGPVYVNSISRGECSSVGSYVVPISERPDSVPATPAPGIPGIFESHYLPMNVGCMQSCTDEGEMESESVYTAPDQPPTPCFTHSSRGYVNVPHSGDNDLQPQQETSESLYQNLPSTDPYYGNVTTSMTSPSKVARKPSLDNMVSPAEVAETLQSGCTSVTPAPVHSPKSRKAIVPPQTAPKPSVSPKQHILSSAPKINVSALKPSNRTASPRPCARQTATTEERLYENLEDPLSPNTKIKPSKQHTLTNGPSTNGSFPAASAASANKKHYKAMYPGCAFDSQLMQKLAGRRQDRE